MQTDLRQLRYFLAFAEELNRAAYGFGQRIAGTSTPPAAYVSNDLGRSLSWRMTSGQSRAIAFGTAETS